MHNLNARAAQTMICHTTVLQGEVERILSGQKQTATKCKIQIDLSFMQRKHACITCPTIEPM